MRLLQSHIETNGMGVSFHHNCHSCLAEKDLYYKPTQIAVTVQWKKIATDCSKEKALNGQIL